MKARITSFGSAPVMGAPTLEGRFPARSEKRPSVSRKKRAGRAVTLGSQVAARDTTGVAAGTDFDVFTGA